VHPSLLDGPALVHVDAYRLGGAAELDDLDLDASLEESVTVVEWGSGLVEGHSDDWLELRLDPVELAPGEDGRVIGVRPHGPRWVGVPLRATTLAP
jgi:tRNA threonylcarbamoyladenosine biosynthesis protein TsaE